MTAFVDVDGFALLCNYSPQHARRVFRDGVEGKSWNGNRLTIVVSDCRGGASGKQYLVAIDSLPPDLQQKAKSLDLPLRKPVARPSHGEIADWQHDEANFRLTVLLPIIPTASGSSERAAAIREVAQKQAEHAPENPGSFPVEMTEIGPQYVIPGCERPAAPKTNGGATHD